MLGWDFRPERTGGVGSACRGLAEALVRIGAEVSVVCPAEGHAEGLAPLRLPASIPSPHPPRGDGMERAAVTDSTTGPRAPSADALRLLRVASPLTPYLTRADYAAAPPPPPASPGLLAEVRRFAEQAAVAAAGTAHDVVHAHDWMTLPAALRVVEERHRPLVWHVHSTELERRPNGPDPAIVALEQHGLDRADRVVAVSRRTAELLGARYRVDPDKLRVVHNAVSPPAGAPARWQRSEDRPLVLFLGRLTEQKDPLTFLRAAALAAPAVPAARFVVAGGGELLPSLMRETERLGLGERVHFTGMLAGEDVERMFALAHVYVMPSVAEPFGIAALEAMCADVPVVITRESGVAEILRNALVIDAGDVGALADRIVSLLLRPALRETLIEQGRVEVATLRWEVRARSLLRIFEELAA